MKNGVCYLIYILRACRYALGVAGGRKVGHLPRGQSGRHVERIAGGGCVEILHSILLLPVFL